MKESQNTAELLVKQGSFDDVMKDIARFHLIYRTFNGKKVRAGRVVVLKANEKTVRVIARGSKGNSKGQITLLSETRERLGISAGETVRFTFVEADILDEFLWAWDATDATVRVAARMAVLSLGLGVLGAMLGMASLVR